LGIALSGTLGLIVQARRRGLIPSARAAFEQLLERDFRIAAEMIREALGAGGGGLRPLVGVALFTGGE
jgi:predicted nucleic acid-binding protein